MPVSPHVCSFRRGTECGTLRELQFKVLLCLRWTRGSILPGFPPPSPTSWGLLPTGCTTQAPRALALTGFGPWEVQIGAGRVGRRTRASAPLPAGWMGWGGVSSPTSVSHRVPTQLTLASLACQAQSWVLQHPPPSHSRGAIWFPPRP